MSNMRGGIVSMLVCANNLLSSTNNMLVGTNNMRVSTNNMRVSTKNLRVSTNIIRVSTNEPDPRAAAEAGRKAGTGVDQVNWQSRRALLGSG
jgi:hypothetical protein